MMTTRQSEALKLIAVGNTVTEIACKFDCSKGTAGKHRDAVYKALGAHEPTEVVHFAVARKLIEEIDLGIFADCFFTSQMLELIKLIAVGKMNKEIADIFGVGVKSAEHYR